MLRDQHSRGGRAGFTLVEISVVAVIVALVFGGTMFVVAQSGKQVWERTDARMATLNQVQIAVNRVSDDLHNASQANLACVAGATATCTTPPCLEFTPAGALPRVTYQRTGAGNLTRTQNGATQTVAANLVTFLPSCGGGGLVRLHVSAQMAGTSGYPMQSIDSQVWAQSP